jgi:homoserine dehydrogenase
MAETDVDADGNRRLFQRVHPHLVHRDHPLAHVDGATNASWSKATSPGHCCSRARARAMARPPAPSSPI